ncbi:MAG: discoidin domain-containing protein [Sandaracinaceae bacterium]|nr:discoidin domain-containing protein [Myxococcales bacterium]MCA9579514.1 discoidin domain-containing protein [Myxococcales bacterium]MCB9656643.1 discoidin domain-containing protein [Sandaracinaceae bacterium]
MPSESTVLRCGNCGANLSPVPGQNVVQCEYCAQATYLTQTVMNMPGVGREQPAASRDSDLHARMMEGPTARPAKGRGRRLTTRDGSREVLCPVERAIWPKHATASTTYGGSWSPSAMVGPPKVFPRYGDIGGAWAPSSSNSRVEWVCVEYDSTQPVTGLRVYETYNSGRVYAVVDQTDGEELVYYGEVSPKSESCALDVTFDAPRVVRKLRVYLTNTSGYTEIDTVALLARDPLPLEQRPYIPPPTKELSVGGAMWAFALVIVGLVVGVVVAVRGCNGSGESSQQYAVPTSTLPGTTILMGTEPLSEIQRRGPRWASSVVDFSSEYTSDGNSAQRATGAPDVYPTAGDLPNAWATRLADGGIQHITLRYAEPVLTTAVFWLETYNPGAVVRVDDVSDPAQVVTLFSGIEPTRGVTGAAAVEVRLPEPRSIHTVRLYLDTNAVTGWNEIDAVALIP